MLLNKFSPILVILLLALIIDTVVECGKDDKPGKKRSRDNQGQKHVAKEETIWRKMETLLIKRKNKIIRWTWAIP
jgi:hypothetical protein